MFLIYYASSSCLDTFDIYQVKTCEYVLSLQQPAHVEDNALTHSHYVHTAVAKCSRCVFARTNTHTQVAVRVAVSTLCVVSMCVYVSFEVLIQAIYYLSRAGPSNVSEVSCHFRDRTS